MEVVGCGVFAGWGGVRGGGGGEGHRFCRLLGSRVRCSGCAWAWMCRCSVTQAEYALEVSWGPCNSKSPISNYQIYAVSDSGLELIEYVLRRQMCALCVCRSSALIFPAVQSVWLIACQIANMWFETLAHFAPGRGVTPLPCGGTSERAARMLAAPSPTEACPHWRTLSMPPRCATRARDRVEYPSPFSSACCLFFFAGAFDRVRCSPLSRAPLLMEPSCLPMRHWACRWIWSPLW